VALRITQVRSSIKVGRTHRGTLRSLGLTGIGTSTLRDDSPQLRGMLHQVGYLVRVEETQETP
jgi:large subunit ribosomal protein L30